MLSTYRTLEDSTIYGIVNNCKPINACVESRSFIILPGQLQSQHRIASCYTNSLSYKAFQLSRILTKRRTNEDFDGTVRGIELPDTKGAA